MALRIKRLYDIDVDCAVGIDRLVIGDLGFMSSAQSMLNRLGSSEQVERSHVGLHAAAEIAELMFALETPWGGVEQGRAASDGSDELLYLMQGGAECLFALAYITAQRKIIAHA